jgi:hypothetical protein
VRAAVGYVPYFGLEILPAFGTGQAGARGLTLRSLRCQARPIRSPLPTSCARRWTKWRWPRGHVLLNGQGHELDPQSGAEHHDMVARIPFRVGERRRRSEEPS